jgi:hypothetical protein
MHLRIDGKRKRRDTKALTEHFTRNLKKLLSIPPASL